MTHSELFLCTPPPHFQVNSLNTWSRKYGLQDNQNKIQDTTYEYNWTSNFVNVCIIDMSCPLALRLLKIFKKKSNMCTTPYCTQLYCIIHISLYSTAIAFFSTVA